MARFALTATLPLRAGAPSRRASVIAGAICLTLMVSPGASGHAQSEQPGSIQARDYHLGMEDKLEILVNVWGEVSNPGSYRVADDTDLVKLISLAGGPTDYANLKKVKITRPNATGEMLIKVNLLDYLEGPSRGNTIGLLPGDTVRVPRNAKHTWRSAIQVLSDVAVIATLYVLIQDRRDR